MNHCLFHLALTFLVKIFLNDISPFCGATDNPVLDFWWHLPWVSKPGWILACVQCIPQIPLWCKTCWPIDGQHGSWVCIIDLLTCTHIQAFVGLKTRTYVQISLKSIITANLLSVINISSINPILAKPFQIWVKFYDVFLFYSSVAHSQYFCPWHVFELPKYDIFPFHTICKRCSLQIRPYPSDSKITYYEHSPKEGKVNCDEFGENLQGI